MATIELNVGFNNHDALGEERVNEVLNARAHLLRSMLHRLDADSVNVRRKESVYTGPEGEATEQTLVVRAVGIPVANLPELSQVLYAIAEEWREDCIAVYTDAYQAGGSGFLVGPKAESWGRFNREFFTTFEEAVSC